MFLALIAAIFGGAAAAEDDPMTQAVGIGLLGLAGYFALNSEKEVS